MAADKKYKLYMVTMSHWDREWYLNFQAFRIRLVHLIDDLIKIMEDDPNFVSYMLDGQTIPLEDYLEIKPQNREKITKFIQEGRIVIGPWYILPDEILISGESHIRNYLMGERVAKQFGEKMNIAYLPDSFGHPSQMPQIIAKLGMEATMFWRGSGPEADKTEFYWEAPDGSRILTVLLPAGYSTGAELPNDPEVVAQRFDKLTEVFEKYLTTDMLYVSNGGDHLEPVPYLSSLIAAVNERMEKGQITHTTLIKFFEDLKPKLGRLKVVKGEMCGVNKATLLGSTLSTRMYLKQLNYKAYTLLENYIEPIHMFASILGYPNPQELILQAWKHFIQNMPHDSVCGCSVDEVHRDMLYRYNQVYEIADYLMYEVGNFYSGIDTKGLKGDGYVTVFNTTAADRTDVVEAVVNLDENVMAALEFNDVERGLSSKTRADSDAANRPLPTGVRLYDGTKEIPCVLTQVKLSDKLQLHWQTYPTQFKVNQCQITFVAPDVPALGYKTFSVVAVYDEKKTAPFGNAVAGLENSYYRIIPNFENGSIDVTDKETGVIYSGCNLFVDSGDCGDEYTYCPPETDLIVYPQKESLRIEVVAQNEVFQTLRVQGELFLPESVVGENVRRSDHKVPCAFTSEITIYAGLKRIDVKTRVANRAKFHRLRVLFPTSQMAQVSYSSGIFSVDERPVAAPFDPNWQELLSTHPQKTFADVCNGEYGLMIANRGLPEFEAYNDRGQTITAVTLLRCVGEISKKQMKARKSMGGWTVMAPEGQCIGEYDFEYSIIPHRGTWEDAANYLRAQDYAVPLKAIQVEKGSGTLPPSASFVKIEPKALVLSAFKACEFEDGRILRFYNTTSREVAGKISFGFPVSKVELAGLNEISAEELPLSGNEVSLKVGPWSIVTLKVK